MERSSSSGSRSKSLPLGIDVHSHVFNGTDLQIGAFFRDIVANDADSEMRPIVAALGSVLQFINWGAAPSAKKELEKLAKPSIAEDRESGYRIGRRALLEARDEAARRTSLAPSTNEALEELLQPTYAQWKAKRDAARTMRLAADARLARDKSIAGAIEFVLHHFNYRHVNVADYLETYAKGSQRTIDLLVASLVDFDWWLAQGRATPSSLQDQVKVMERISVVAGGQVHGFVPFCPFREAMHPDQSMALVRDAIENRGFIGVKLYPPMGFAPYGNTGLGVWRDNPGTLPAEALRPDFGARLDAAMKRLFDWCRDPANDVPIMAHTNHSNGPNSAFEDLAGPQYWKQALEAFPGLRVNFGHFGGEHTDKMRAFVALMKGRGGALAYGDSGYFEHVLSDAAGVRRMLTSLYADPSTALIASRFMYGSDWEMIIQERDVDRYFDRFMEVMRDLEPDAFFGRNAAVFLGLAPGGRNRARLEAFYARAGVGQPGWMAKAWS